MEQEPLGDTPSKNSNPSKSFSPWLLASWKKQSRKKQPHSPGVSHQLPFQPRASSIKHGKGTPHIPSDAVTSTDPYSTLGKGKHKLPITSNRTQTPMPPHSEASLSTKLNHLASQRKNQPTLSKSEATKGTTSYKPSSNGAEPLKPSQPSAPFCFSAGSPFLNTPKLTTPPHLSTLSHLAMGNMDQQQGNGAERHNDQQYHMGFVDDLQVEKKALMNSWSFIFPLTEVSKRDGCLPLTHPAWHNTPNLWWRFMPDRPPLLPPPEQRTSRTSRSRLQSILSKTLLDLIEKELTPVEIIQRKFLIWETTGVLIQGILPQLKLIQTLMETEIFTLETVTYQTQMNLLGHAIVLA